MRLSPAVNNVTISSGCGKRYGTRSRFMAACLQVPDVLNEPGRPALYNQWADAYFLGSDGLTIWNTTIITAVREFWTVVEEIAHTRASGDADI